MAGQTVSAGYAGGLMKLAVAKGAGHEALLARSGIAPVDLDDPDNRIPFAKYVALMRAAKELSGDPALALHYGEINITEVSVVGLIGHACETMLEAHIQLNRYVRLVVDIDLGGADRFQMRHANGALWAVDTRSDPGAFPELTESAFAQLVCGPRELGVTQVAEEVHFTHPEPAWRAEYDRIFRVPLVFGSRWNAMRIDQSWATHRIARLPRYVFGVLTDHADALLEKMARPKTVRDRVESLLMPVLHTGEVGIETVAARIGMSRQTLYRRLKAEGVSFEKVLDELRHRMALQYLGGGRTSVNQTAFLCGFSDPAAFSRAFKRWTGSSPRAARPKSGDGGKA